MTPIFQSFFPALHWYIPVLESWILVLESGPYYLEFSRHQKGAQNSKTFIFFYLMMISIIYQVIIQGLEYRRFCFRFNQNLPSNSNPYASSIQKITLGRFKALFIFFKNPEILAFDIAARVIIAEICNNHESSVHNFPTMVKGQLLIW